MINSIVSKRNIYHIAAKYGLLDVLVEANGNELNTRDEFGRMPIHYAALKGHLSALKAILILGGKASKCDWYGNSALHYAVRSRNLNCISFLVNYEPKLIWMMDINNLNAKQLAQTLEYEDVVVLLDEFVDKQLNVKVKEFYQFQKKELKKAEKRRQKYLSLMKSAAKNQMDEYKKINLGRQETRCETSDQIILDDNIILSNTHAATSSNSCLLSSSFKKKHEKKNIFYKFFHKSANQSSQA